MIKTNGWVKLESEHGYEVSLKSFMVEGKMQTVVIDNFSVTPFTIQPYDMNEIEINWDNIYCNTYILFNTYEVRDLQYFLSAEDFQEVYDFMLNDLEYIQEYKLTSEDGEVSIIDEYTLRHQANYYLNNSDDVELLQQDTNFFDCPIEDVIEFVNRIDEVEEI
ncbi:hypothetical protein BH780_gp236 [Bacillus phage Eldridge]|uniref:Uncharacterized protein n=1 Tax=Bacillus phage Eldridge TaxID=1776293 RepID=A0A109Z8I1_9CAUD|nr:hypothetical protein BH780_gp006 [Bacillus phage Eldridge]YP_009274943.1 hypothetical protein BH780_gp236 [Bacillus phage Eldridge]AMB18817.1 hypothetical protein Eldridge_0239 [Bacillus phage Eldridge]AMB18820.1 hypothetical protein Eldridge_06 [Bacillus phage Eldridge]